jgi:hypothetical protein
VRTGNENRDFGVAKISVDLRRLERRDLWAWMNVVVIILGLTGAVFSLSASLQWMGMKTVLGVDYRVAVSALVILVPALTVQKIYQQIKVRKLQRERKSRMFRQRCSADWPCSIRLRVCTIADLRSRG